MQRTRNRQIMTIALIMASIVGLGVGFAAFSSSLSIKSGVSVSPDSSTFSVKFSSSATAQERNPIEAVTNPETLVAKDGEIDAVDATTISNLSVEFTQPDQTATYTFYARNTGAYLAYLNMIQVGEKTCTPGEGTDADLVAAACDALSVSVRVGTNTVTETESITNHTLAAGSSEEVIVTLEYAKDGARADGPFTVTFGDISLTYATTAESQDIPEVYIGWDQSCKLISGTVYEVGSKYTCKFMGDFDNETEVDFYMLQSDLDAGMVYLITVETFGSGMTQYEAQISAEADFLMEYRLNGESFSLPTYGQLYAVDNSETLPSWLHGEYWLASEGGEDVYSVFGDTISSDHSSAGARFVYNLSTI